MGGQNNSEDKGADHPFGSSPSMRLRKLQSLKKSLASNSFCGGNHVLKNVEKSNITALKMRLSAIIRP